MKIGQHYPLFNDTLGRHTRAKAVGAVPQNPGIYYAARNITAYKKVIQGGIWSFNEHSRVAKILIPKGAIIVVPRNAERGKFRVSEAKVVAIYKAKPNKRYCSWWGSDGRHLTYRKGKTVRPHRNINLNISYDCGSGIHLLRTRKTAEEWR